MVSAATLVAIAITSRRFATTVSAVRAARVLVGAAPRLVQKLITARESTLHHRPRAARRVRPDSDCHGLDAAEGGLACARGIAAWGRAAEINELAQSTLKTPQPVTEAPIPPSSTGRSRND
jgi:hypothetical protein